LLQHTVQARRDNSLPAFNANAPLQGVPLMIPNPGIQIGYMYEKQLKILGYYILHLQQIQRQFVPTQATLARLTACYCLKEHEEGEDISLPQKMTRTDKCREVLEVIDNYLTQKLQFSGPTLAYIAQEEVAIPPAADDPGYGMSTIHQPTYQVDNQEVWQLIRHVNHGGPGWS
jgi:hypothetical protein